MSYGAFSLNKGNSELNGEGPGSLIEVFCTINYTSWSWVCSFKILRHTLKAYHKIKLLLLSFESKFRPKNFLFYTMFKVFSFIYLHELILWCFLVYFLSALACESWFIYNLLSIASFSYDLRDGDGKWIREMCTHIAHWSIGTCGPVQSISNMCDVIENLCPQGCLHVIENQRNYFLHKNYKNMCLLGKTNTKLCFN